MGAYLSQPVTKKVSSDGESDHLIFGDSSMQGWRVSQEDAHNSLPTYLPGCSLFAVYDGHGGHEVAAYTAQTLPSVISKNPLYAGGQVREGLRQAFLEFDASLTRQEIIDKLKAIAGREAESEEEDETDREVDELFQEAHMPLEELMARYSGDKPAAGGVAKLKQKQKPLSPFLRAKAGGSGVASGTTNSEANDSGGGGDGVKKDLSAEMTDAKPEPNSESESKPESAPKSPSKTKAESAPKSEPESEPAPEAATTEEINSDSNSKPDPESTPSAKVNGAGDSPHPTSDTKHGETDDAESPPACNGSNGANGTASPVKAEEKSPVKKGKGGKGARPGSGKSPAPAAAKKAAAAAAGRATRKMPERAAAEIYKDVLEGARLAREAGHAEEEAEEEEEEEDDDFNLEQSDSGEDGEEDAEEDSDEEEEEEVEEDEDEDSDQDEDELGDEEEAGDDEDGDFMLNMKDEPGSDSGCTAVVALLHGRELYVANIGDSRCVLSRSGRAVDMSADHKPEDETELQRIVKAGGKVTMDGRVNGGLNLSRAFGDHAYKADKSLAADQQMISASPDVRCVTIDPDTDEFMVLACDGIWNSKKSQEVVDFVSERIRERGETQLSHICEELFDECLAPNTMGDGTGCDNMTCIIVRFKPSLASVEAPAVAQVGVAKRPDAASPDGPPEKRPRTE